MARKKFRIKKKPVAPKKANYRGRSRSKKIMGSYDSDKIGTFIANLLKHQEDYPDATVEMDLDYGGCYYESDTPSACLKLNYVECADIAYNAAVARHKQENEKYKAWFKENEAAIKQELELRTTEEKERVLKKATRLEKEAAKLRKNV